MSAEEYTPPKVWTWDKESGGRFANINRPIAGATHDKDLQVGKHPIQLYSLGTPNGVKVTIMLEELLELGHAGAEYDAWLVNIGEGDQFGSGFVSANPNSKIPAMMDHTTDPPVRVFESAAILVYLAEKFGAFLPDGAARAECLSWLFWQMGSAPYLGGGFGHFYAYAPVKLEYPIDRFAMEVKRQLDVLDKHLAENQFLPVIIQSPIWQFIRGMAGLPKGCYMNPPSFCKSMNTQMSFVGLMNWPQRPGVKRGRIVNRVWDSHKGLAERHDASDFDQFDL